MNKLPTQDELLRYFKELSNWGKWGTNDQMGTLNYINDSVTLEATSMVQKGYKVSCSRPIEFIATPDAPNPPVHYMLESGDGLSSKSPEGDSKITSKPSQVAMDYIGMVFHGHSITHIDSLAHFFWKGKMYNDRPAYLISNSKGATVESVEIASTRTPVPSSIPRFFLMYGFKSSSCAYFTSASCRITGNNVANSTLVCLNPGV